MGIVGFLIFMLICLAHIGVFWATYKKTKGEFNFLRAGLRGAITAVIVNYFLAIPTSLFIHPWWVLIHFYLIPFEAIGGAVFTILYWYLIEKFDLQINIVARVSLGLLFGALIGLAFAFLTTDNIYQAIHAAISQANVEHNTKQKIILFVAKIIFFSYLSVTSAIVVNVKKLK